MIYVCDTRCVHWDKDTNWNSYLCKRCMSKQVLMGVGEHVAVCYFKYWIASFLTRTSSERRWKCAADCAPSVWEVQCKVNPTLHSDLTFYGISWSCLIVVVFYIYTVFCWCCVTLITPVLFGGLSGLPTIVKNKPQVMQMNTVWYLLNVSL